MANKRNAAGKFFNSPHFLEFIKKRQEDQEEIKKSDKEEETEVYE